MRLEILFRLLFLGWLGIVVFMTINPTPPHLVVDRFGDKFEHAMAFAGLAGLAGLGFARAEPLRIAERLSFFGALIEVFQAIPSLHRSCDWKDWVADTLGVALGLVLVPVAQMILPMPKVLPAHAKRA